MIPAPSRLLVFVVTAVFAAGALAVDPRAHAMARQRPLPDVAALLRQSREHLRDDWRLENRYSYVERRTDYAPASNGSEQPKSVKVFEIHPGTNGRPSRRLVEVNGRRRSADELARDDRERLARAAERQRQRERETPVERQRRLEREARDAREEQETWDDLGRVYRFTVTGRQIVNGESLVVVDFVPRPDAQPRTDNGERMMKVKGRAWIAEDDSQVARVDAQVLEDISIGWGLVGKLYAGARASYVRQKVNGGFWLPQQLSYTATGRAFIRRFALHTVIDYYDYRKVG